MPLDTHQFTIKFRSFGQLGNPAAIEGPEPTNATQFPRAISESNSFGTVGFMSLLTKAKADARSRRGCLPREGEGLSLNLLYRTILAKSHSSRILMAAAFGAAYAAKT